MSKNEVAKGVWNLLEGGMVSCFLVVGSEKALLIDTGFGQDKLRPIIAEITDLPVVLVNTHGHGDHVGGNAEFDEFYISSRDIPIMEGDSSKAVPVEEGHKFELGGRTLEVIATPGHTPGSISLIDRENRLVFVGDMLSKRPVFFIPGMSDINDFIASMDKLEALSGEYDTIICCHGEAKLSSALIARYKAVAREFAAGGIEPKTQEMGPRKMNLFVADDGLGFICPVK